MCDEDARARVGKQVQLGRPVHEADQVPGRWNSAVGQLIAGGEHHAVAVVLGQPLEGVQQVVQPIGRRPVPDHNRPEGGVDSP